MLVVWCKEGRPRLPSMAPDQRIAYISDVGAQGLKPLFIATSTVMAIALDLALISDRWLRHKGRLARNRNWYEKTLSVLSVLSAIGGSVGIISLTIMDTYRHPTLHDRFIAVFVVGYVLSAIFICSSYASLGFKIREYRLLRATIYIKAVFAGTEIALAIGIFYLSHLLSPPADFSQPLASAEARTTAPPPPSLSGPSPTSSPSTPCPSSST